MSRLIVIMCFLSGVASAQGGDRGYAVAAIPPELLKNANVVKRMEEISFEIINTGEAILKKKYALTILNEYGSRHAAFVEYYDKLHEIKDVEGVLFDENGKELKKLRNRQVIDVSGVSGNNLIDDNRVKAHHFMHNRYPYTVQYEVRIKYDGTLFFPTWLPREDEKFSVQASSIRIICDPEYIVRYKAFNYEGKPVESVYEKNKKMISWEVRNQPAIEAEFAAPDWQKINTWVIFGPGEFEIEKYKGRMNDWKDFGSFVYSLKAGRDQLPEDVKKLVHEISSKYADPREKVEQLYYYLQKNTRYISIQLGIGGWQPFDAGYVATKAYGDCKALTNYMYSLLKEAGIPSIYSLVRAGRNAGDVIEDFPSQQFNHVILSVPLKTDTMWLECTSQTLPAGYLSDFTANRYALLVTETNSKLVKTPAYGIKENSSTRIITARLDEAANLDINASSVFTGLMQDLYHHMSNSEKPEKIKEYLHRKFDLPTYEVTAFNYTPAKSRIPAVTESLQIKSSNYATITGKRLFINPNVLSRSDKRLNRSDIRSYEIELGPGYITRDSVEIIIPDGYKHESIPGDISISTPFGSYAARIKFEGNRLRYNRQLIFNGGKFPASAYNDLVSFYEAIYSGDKNKVVLVREGLKGF